MALFKFLRPQTRSNYWSDSRFADWVVRTFTNTPPKPECAQLHEFDEWDKRLKQDSRFVFWFTDKFLPFLQDLVMFPADLLNSMRIYIKNRFIDKVHYLQTGLKPGQFYDLDTRMLYGLFNELVNFIEIEKAWMYVVFDNDAKKTFNVPWWRTGWKLLRFRSWRSPEAGIAYLSWEMGLTMGKSMDEYEGSDKNELSPQALYAKEQYELYNWWKNVRPNRPDPYEESGFSALNEKRREARMSEDPTMDGSRAIFAPSRTDEERDEMKRVLNRLHEIEEAYDREDEEMLIRLIKIRHSLWT